VQRDADLLADFAAVSDDDDTPALGRRALGDAAEDHRFAGTGRRDRQHAAV
jgi:hypothetical protein